MAALSERGLEPPETRRDDVTERLHGHEITDPYRWLEGSTEAVREWTARQNAYTDTYLETPRRNRLRPSFEDVAAIIEYGAVVARGGRYFQRLESPQDDHPILTVQAAVEADRTIIVDPNTWAANRSRAEPPLSMAWYLPAPDGEHVAYGVTAGGDEQYDIHVVSVPDGGEVGVISDCGRVNLQRIAWTPDSEGLYFIGTGTAAQGRQLNTELRYWNVEAGEKTLHEFGKIHEGPVVETDPDAGTVAVGLDELGGGTDWYIYADGGLRPVFTETDAETDIVFHDGRVYVSTDHGAPSRRVVSCSGDRFRAGDVSLADCDPVVPERTAVLQSLVPTADHLVAHYLHETEASVVVYDGTGDPVRRFSLPRYASISDLAGNREADEVFYQVTSFDRPPSVVQATPASGSQRSLTSVDMDVPNGVVMHREFVDSSDGATVPLFLCHREDLALDGSNPTVLRGYGGFRNTMTPSFDRFRLPFLESGGVYSQVCARGGYEYGEEWHEAGMRASKQHTFDDFIAAGEFLCGADYTSPAKLTLAGVSNGGLAVGAVVTQRPALWAGAVCTVPLLDMLRYHEFLLGDAWTTEYGSPDNPGAFEYLREYSPYHNLSPDTTYPPILFRTAESDTRVHPCHARKMTARLQAEANGGPFLLRTMPDTGHGVGKPTSMVVDEQLDKWTFLYACFDHDGPSGPGTGETATGTDT